MEEAQTVPLGHSSLLQHRSAQTCDVPATALSARSLSNNSHPANSTSVAAISASAHCAVDLLSNELLAMESNHMYVVKEIHAEEVREC